MLAITSDLSRIPRLMAKLNLFIIKGYLYESGWIKSFIKRLPYDKAGMPLPWVTYAFIDFINNRLNEKMTVFEYGSGNSTFFYAAKVKAVTSVEHDQSWHDKLHHSMPSNVTLIHKELSYNGTYSRASIQPEKFDIIIVDGRDRVNCLKQSIHALTDNGVIVLDDSERESYQEGGEFLVANQFKRLDFWGISPGLFYKKCTTIFYKKNNILNI